MNLTRPTNTTFMVKFVSRREKIFSQSDRAFLASTPYGPYLHGQEYLTESGGTVVSPHNSHLGDPGSILARGRPPWEGFQWFSFPLQVNTRVVPLQIGHAVYLPPTHPSPSSRYSAITPLFASQLLTTSPFHSDYKKKPAQKNNKKQYLIKIRKLRTSHFTFVNQKKGNFLMCTGIVH